MIFMSIWESLNRLDDFACFCVPELYLAICVLLAMVFPSGENCRINVVTKFGGFSVPLMLATWNSAPRATEFASFSSSIGR